MPTRRVTFPNAAGHELSGLLDGPADPEACALLAHCFTCTKNLKVAATIGRALAEAGIATLRFDFTGLGESEGDFAATTFATNVDDLVAAAEFMDRELAAPQLLIGHSLGGAAVLQAAARIPAAAVATINSPCDPQHVLELLGDRRREIETRGEAEVTLGARTFTIRRQFLDNLAETRMADTIAGLGRALLILHAPLDTTVAVDNAARIFQMARHPKSFVSLDGADHLLSDPGDARYAGAVIAAWAGRYLDAQIDGAAGSDRGGRAPRQAPAGGAQATAGDSVWVEMGRDKYRTGIHVRGHAFTADEPRDAGGGDRGPTPYDLLLAALGACTAMTLRMYADHKGWDLESVQVKLDHHKVHAEDCAECETRRGKVDRIERQIGVTGALDAAQRMRLLEIADRCPVHRTLHSEISVRTRPEGSEQTVEGRGE